jgi:uncharacterized protein (DUF885 family)
MKQAIRALIFSFLYVAITLCPATTCTAAPARDAAFMTLADDFFDNFYFPESPTTATSVGIHRYDDKLDDYSRAGIVRQRKSLRAYLNRVESFDRAGLSERVRGDRELVLSTIRSSLLTLDAIRPLEQNPDVYPSGIAASAFSIMERTFASPNVRLRALVARERRMPAVFVAARQNLRNPPKVYTEIAIEQLPGTTGFFKNDLPLAFAAADDPALIAEFKAVNDRVVAALESYGAWLRRDLLPRSKGDFRLGAANFRAKLAADEMVDTPLDELLRIGYADLRRNQAEFARVAHEIEPTKTPKEVLAMLVADHPPPDQLFGSFRATFDGLTAFIRDKQIITIPSDVRPILRETPPFMRATTSASMDTPGPYETVAQEAYFNVTLPEPGWDADRVKGFMSQFNFPVISNTSVHETYPGHYVQFLWMHQVDDRVRKLLGANTNAEGWAHYCEQMMLDEGLAQSAAGAKDAHGAGMMRLGQLQDALLRNARYIVGIRMHTEDMTIEQAINFFVDEGYESREVGEAETKRGTADPTYLYYTLGKLQILKLRADLKARQGASFSLKAFHDGFMREGFPPIRIVRRALLGDDSPTL